MELQGDVATCKWCGTTGDADSIRRRECCGALFPHKTSPGLVDGYACPVCGNTGRFMIQATVECEVEDDGIGDTGAANWTQDSEIQCPVCKHAGCVRDFLQRITARIDEHDWVPNGCSVAPIKADAKGVLRAHEILLHAWMFDTRFAGFAYRLPNGGVRVVALPVVYMSSGSFYLFMPTIAKDFTVERPFAVLFQNHGTL